MLELNKAVLGGSGHWHTNIHIVTVHSLKFTKYLSMYVQQQPCTARCQQAHIRPCSPSDWSALLSTFSLVRMCGLLTSTATSSMRCVSITRCCACNPSKQGLSWFLAPGLALPVARLDIAMIGCCASRQTCRFVRHEKPTSICKPCQSLSC